MTRRSFLGSPVRLAGLALVAALVLACGTTPQLPVTDFASLLPSEPTFAPPPTPAVDPASSEFTAPPFAAPPIPEGLLQPLVGPAPDWWYLVPIHPAMYAAGSVGRTYHYAVTLPTEEITAFYEQGMRRGGWQIFMDPLLSGPYSLLSYSHDDTLATIYIYPQGSGSLVSIVIQ